MTTLPKAASASRRLDGSSFAPFFPQAGENEPLVERRTVPPVQVHRRGVPQGQAKVLDMAQVPKVLRWAELHETVPEAAVLKLCLSFYAGLRSCETSRLKWRDVTDSQGRIKQTISVPPRVAKGRRPREIPMHDSVRWALARFHERYPDLEHLAICRRDGKHQKPGALKAWYRNFFIKMGLKGCSSHSGRRSLITFLANNHGRLGMSLRDVQLIAGHASLATTQAYIEPSKNLHRLIDAVPWMPWDGPENDPRSPARSASPNSSPPWPAHSAWGDDPPAEFASGAWGNALRAQ